MSEIFPESAPSPFGPDGPPSAMIEESRRAHALELATDLVAAREQGQGSIFSASVLAGDVVDVARCFENYLRGGGDA